MVLSLWMVLPCSGTEPPCGTTCWCCWCEAAGTERAYGATRLLRDDRSRGTPQPAAPSGHVSYLPALCPTHLLICYA
eukprot:317592-Rhodomonas_salina.1